MVNLFEYKLYFYRVHHFLCVGQIQDIGIIQFYRCWRSSTGVLVLSSSCSSLENRVTELKFMVSSKVQAMIQMSQQNFDNLSYSYVYTSSFLINKINYDEQKKEGLSERFFTLPQIQFCHRAKDSYSKIMHFKAYRHKIRVSTCVQLGPTKVCSTKILFSGKVVMKSAVFNYSCRNLQKYLLGSLVSKVC